MSHQVSRWSNGTWPFQRWMPSWRSEWWSETAWNHWLSKSKSASACRWTIKKGHISRIRTTPQEDNSPPYRFWSWWVVSFRGSGPSGELSWWGIVLGIVVLVGNGWALFFIYWGFVLMGSCPWPTFLTRPCVNIRYTNHQYKHQGPVAKNFYPRKNSGKIQKLGLADF